MSSLPRVQVADCAITHTGKRACTAKGDLEFAIDDWLYKVPDGFEFNGASIPPFLWNVLYKPEDPAVLLPALIHDWLYRIQPNSVTRKIADDAFLALLGWTKASRWKSKVMWAGVRLFGWVPWAKYRARNRRQMC